MRKAAHRTSVAGIVLLTLVVQPGCDSPKATRWPLPDPDGWTRPPPPPPVVGDEPAVYESITVAPWCFECVDAGTATITIDGQATNLSKLRNGSIVAMHGARAIEAGFPYRWKFRDARKPFVDSVESWTLLQGPVDSIDVHNARLVVMQQPVQFLRTVVDLTDPVPAAALDGVLAGDVVRVSGYRSEDGHILATRIDHVDPADVAEFATARIVGRLAAGDEYLDYCFIGDLLVSTCYERPASNAYQAGKVVAVAGTYEVTPSSGLLRAEYLTALGNGYRLLDPRPAPGVLVSVEALSSGPTEGVFPPIGQVALIDMLFEDRSCEYDAGFTRQANQLWHLEGLSANDGIVRVACYIGYSPFDEHDGAATAVGVAGPVEAIDLGAQTLTVMGVTLQLNFVSRLGTSNYEPGFGDYSYTVRPLTEIDVGSYAEARGYAGASDNRMLAHTILVESYEPEADTLRYYGTPSAPDGTAISLLGQLIRVDGETVYIDERLEPCIATDAGTFFGEPPQAIEVRVADTVDGLVAQRVAMLGASPPQGYCPL